MTSGGGRTHRPAGFFALRAPILPFDELVAFGEGLTAPAADPAGLAEALARDGALLTGRLTALMERPELREALFVASPDLEAALETYRKEPGSEKGRRVERALYRYFARCAGRATPFGLFASSTTGRVAEETRLDVPRRDQLRRHTRLDMDYLVALADAVARDRDLRAGFPIRLNSSLYQAAGRYRLVEQRLKGRERTYHLVAIEATPHLEAALAAAESLSPAALAAAVREADPDVTDDEARSFVDELVEGQVLVPDLGLRVTGDEPARGFAAGLLAHPPTAEAGRRLLEAVEELDRMDRDGLGGPPSRYRDVAASLDGLPAPAELSRLFQVDLAGDAEPTLGSGIVEEIWRAVEHFRRICPSGRRTDLAAFREAFLERYEEQEVPLLEALDEEMGVGFPPYRSGGTEGAPLLQGLPFPGGDEGSVRWGDREKLLIDRVGRLAARGERELVLTEEDVPRLGAAQPAPLPDAFFVVARLFRLGARGLPSLVLDAVGGPAGANLLGRFCHVDPDLARLVAEHLAAEEALQPDAVFAEVVHLPEGRVGNILLRPLLRAHEIPFLGGSGAPPERQIPLSDLTVSVDGGRVVLRSRRLGRRVIPRLTTAHNYSYRSIGIYRFLGELQLQGCLAGWPFAWGVLEAAPFLPRVRFGRVVLAAARWRLGKRELTGLARKDAAGRYTAMQQLRAELGLPRFVLLADSDNELPVDLDSTLAVESFVSLVERRDSADLKEMLPGPGELAAEGPLGRHVHELVVPFIRVAAAAAGGAKAVPAAAGMTAPTSPAVAVARTFPPGSEWLYLKLYAGTSSADTLLSEVLGPMAEEAVASGAVDRWFFLRFADPREHLRLRLHGDPERLPDLLRALQTACGRALQEGRAWKLQLDTYEREVERYGGPSAIELVERIFHADSEAVLRILGMLEEGDAGADERWRLALRGADVLLDDLGLDRDRKKRLVSRMRGGLAREMREDADLKRAIGERYRPMGRELAALLDPSHDAGSALEPGFEALRARSERLAPLAAELSRLFAAGLLIRSVDEIAESLVHMFFNRLLRSAHRRQELVLHDFLGRLYARPAGGGDEAAALGAADPAPG